MAAVMIAQVGSLTVPAIAVTGAGFVSIPIAIHLLTRLRRRPQPWAAMQFLFAAQRRHRHRLRLEQQLLLAVRCLIPLLLGLALSGPLLGGCAGGVGGLFGNHRRPGRLVCVIIDNALSSQTTGPSGHSRLDRLRQLALSVMDGLSANDRVVIWQTAQPAGMVHGGSALDPAGGRRVIESIQSRHSRSDLVGTLSLVDDYLKNHGASSEHAFVVVASDFAYPSLPVDRWASQGFGGLGKATLLVARPMPEAVNTQIRSLLPQWATVLPWPDGRAPTVPVELKLRRFVDLDDSQLIQIQVDVLNPDQSDPVVTVRQDHRWAPGQAEAVINLNVPLLGWVASAGPTTWPGPDASRTLAIRARIAPTDPASDGDALVSDDERWALVQLRRQLRVGLVDQPLTDPLGGAPTGMTGATWVRLALAPDGANAPWSWSAAVAGSAPSVFGVEDMDPVNLTQSSLEAADAVLVLRPDLLDRRAWVSLHGLAQRGGLVWLFAPPDDRAAGWGAALTDQLGLDWRLGPLVAASDPTGDRLDGGRSVPIPLSVLGADWKGLLAPVRIDRRLDLTLGQPATSQDAIWLATSSGEPLLVWAPIGQGSVVFLATAVDPLWTNLPTKPLFVPLLHETIRVASSQSGAGGRLRHVVCGQRPELGSQWSGIDQIVLRLPKQRSFGPVALRAAGKRLQPELVMDAPGVYSPVAGGIGRALAVNPDADGGDTRSLDPVFVEQRFSSIGRWHWLEAQNAATLLRVQVTSSSLTWPLLWAVLCLVVLETCLARWFSHARRTGPGWLGWLIALWRGDGGGVARGSNP